MNYNLIMSNKYKTDVEEGERGIKLWLRERQGGHDCHSGNYVIKSINN